MAEVNTDIGTMPVRELITEMRKQAAELPREDFIRTLFINIMVNRIEQEAQQKGEPWDQAVKLMGGVNIVEQVVELAQAAGKVQGEIPEAEQKVILASTVQKYYNQKMATGEISKEQAARDASLAAQAQAQVEGADVSGTMARAKATEGVKQDNTNAVATAVTQPGGMPTPQPSANPMKPDTTMKEVLAGGQGGLLNA